MRYKALYHPSDVEQAHASWNANCGPGALAAVLGVNVARVRRLFPDFDRKPYVNPSTLWTALALGGRQGQKCGTTWPGYGLAFLQWHGPWLGEGVPPTVAYRYTHWVGCAATPEHGQMVYDINAWQDAETRGDWVPLAWWEHEVKPAITEDMPRATGDYHVRWACEVLPRLDDQVHAWVIAQQRSDESATRVLPL